MTYLSVLVILIIILLVGVLVYFNYKLQMRNQDYDKNTFKIKKPKHIRFKDQVKYNTELNKIITKPDRSTSSEPIVMTPHYELSEMPTESDIDVYDTPLVSPKIHDQIKQKIMQEYSDYTNAESKYYQYLTDRDGIIEPEFPVQGGLYDPKRDEGKTVGEVYDALVSGYKYKPLKVKSTSAGRVEYYGDREMNTGRMEGTQIRYYDGDEDCYARADF